MAAEQSDLLKETQASVERMQQFDTATLPQEVRLGTDLCFRDAVEPANRLLSLYRKLTLPALEDFPGERLTQIKDSANSDFGLFQKILQYSPTEHNKTDRDNLVNQLKTRYDAAFGLLHPFISYSMHKATDFKDLDARARAQLQDISDRSKSQEREISAIKEEAKSVLDQVKQVAAEQGVTQQAIYFREEADKHDVESKKWLKWTILSGIVVGLYAVALLTFTSFGFPALKDKYEIIQFTTSKLLLFFILSLALYFTIKNYFSHKHNAVVNRHRQNALVTYRGIVEAAGNSANTDIILNQAATCIFAPQETGFTSQKASNVGSSSSPLSFLLKQATGEKGE